MSASPSLLLPLSSESEFVTPFKPSLVDSTRLLCELTGIVDACDPVGTLERVEKDENEVALVADAEDLAIDAGVGIGGAHMLPEDTGDFGLADGTSTATASRRFEGMSDADR